MIAVLREGPFRVVIWANDHEPAHVHVFRDGEAKINLATREGHVELVWALGMTRSDVRAAMRLVAENRLKLLARWAELHG